MRPLFPSSRLGLFAGLGLLLASSLFASAAEEYGHAEPFKNDDVVCFVGDSITHGGTYHAMINLFYATRFPDRKVSVFNCGVGGDRAAGIMSDEPYRVNIDVLGHKPTVATIMLGMNDIGHGDYKVPSTPEIEKHKEASLATYDAAMQKLIAALQKGGAKVILLTPSIYDETTKLDRARKDITVGGNQALGTCAEKMHGWSKQYGTGLVQFHEVMNTINTREQQKDPNFTIVGPDRVHPGPLGHFVMAYTFLKAQGMPQNVAVISVDGKTGKASGAENCTISEEKVSATGVEFTCLEKALPMVVPREAEVALQQVPFMAELNREPLVVKGLAAGDYEVKIDGASAGTFSAAQLEAGVDLAANKATPQYQQSAEATKISGDRVQAGLQVRQLAAEFYGLSRGHVDVKDPAAVAKKINDRLEMAQKTGKPVDPRTQAFADTYQQMPQREKTYEDLAAKLQQACQPKPHRFVLTRK